MFVSIYPGDSLKVKMISHDGELGFGYIKNSVFSMKKWGFFQLQDIEGTMQDCQDEMSSRDVLCGDELSFQDALVGNEWPGQDSRVRDELSSQVALVGDEMTGQDTRYGDDLSIQGACCDDKTFNEELLCKDQATQGEDMI